MHTYAETNMQTAAYRLTGQGRGTPTTQERIARLERYFVEMRAFSWTQTYKDALAQYLSLAGVAWSGEVE